MACWVKFERWKVTEYRHGSIYKTKRVGSRWFPMGKCPDTDIQDVNHGFWVSTSDNSILSITEPLGDGHV